MVVRVQRRSRQLRSLRRLKVETIRKPQITRKLIRDAPGAPQLSRPRPLRLCASLEKLYPLGINICSTGYIKYGTEAKTKIGWPLRQAKGGNVARNIYLIL